jgi:3-phenylpropionate/trans-cinnamate dioxygenase ferredoxin reductase subunit
MAPVALEGVLTLGAGQAGFQVALSLREEGFDGPVTLLGAEAELPYQRPPLSKAFLAGEATRASLALRPAGFYAERGIALRLGDAAIGIDRDARRVRLASGATLAYGHLVLATGARNRTLPVAGAALPGVHALRDVAEAEALRAAMAGSRRMAVIGAGFIGLECAAAAAARGIAVTVFEAAAWPMARAVSALTSAAFQALHEAAGIRFVFGAKVAAVLEAEGRAAGVGTADGQRHAADLVLTGIGAEPETDLAKAAGLPVAPGVAVDALLRTADPAISAIGDCAAYPLAEGGLCLESVQAAVDGARCVAARIAGRPRAYAATPWFWSDQGAARLQIAGLGRGHDQAVMRGAPGPGGFSVFLYRGGRLVAVESASRPADHVQARRILAAGATLPPEFAADPGYSLRSVAA